MNILIKFRRWIIVSACCNKGKKNITIINGVDNSSNESKDDVIKLHQKASAPPPSPVSQIRSSII